MARLNLLLRSLASSDVLGVKLTSAVKCAIRKYICILEKVKMASSMWSSHIAGHYINSRLSTPSLTKDTSIESMLRKFHAFLLCLGYKASHGCCQMLPVFVLLRITWFQLHHLRQPCYQFDPHNDFANEATSWCSRYCQGNRT